MIAILLAQIVYGGGGASGTANQVLHGNAAGQGSWSSVTDTDLANAYAGVGSCTAGNYVSGLNRNAVPTCLALPAGGSGTVTSVAETVPTELSISGSPITLSGTLALTWAVASGNKVIASPGDGSSGAYAGRALVAADIPSLNASIITAGTFADTRLTDAYSGTGACATHKWTSTLTRDAAPTCTQPDYSDLTGTPTIPADISGKKYIIQTADAALPNAQALGALATGLVQNTTTTGILSIYSGSGTCSASNWITALSATGAKTCTQPGFQDLASGATVDSPLTGSGLTASHLGCQAASGSQAGCLSSTDWTTFNNKQAAGAYLTSITGGAAVTNKWINSISSGGAATLSQPDFSDLSGAATTTQIPNLDTAKITTGTLSQARGGTGAGSLICANGEFLTSDGTSQYCKSILTPSSASPVASNLPFKKSAPLILASNTSSIPAAFSLPCNAVRRLNCR